jgi:hypothetical protein
MVDDKLHTAIDLIRAIRRAGNQDEIAGELDQPLA